MKKFLALVAVGLGGYIIGLCRRERNSIIALLLADDIIDEM